MFTRFIGVKFSLGIVPAFSHVKPFPHQHIGFLHPEDLITLLGVLFTVLMGGVIVYAFVKRTARGM